MLTFKGLKVEVDVLRELSRYDWNKSSAEGENFLACSPFRSERRPSFYVRLNNGIWIDHGAEEDAWKQGDFIKLLSWLRNETREETEEYLLSEYSPILGADVDSLKLSFNLTLDEGKRLQALNADVLRGYRLRHPYLGGRGVEEGIQRAFGVGYDRRTKAITLPWFNRAGELVNIKFRSVRGKHFWYYAGGQPVRFHIYGINLLYKVKDRARAERVYLVESEIDAMTLWQNGIAALALGGANMTVQQRQIILQAPIRNLTIATDNDKAGRRIAASIVQQLAGLVKLREVRFPAHIKDINEVPLDRFSDVVNNTFDVGLGLEYKEG